MIIPTAAITILPFRNISDNIGACRIDRLAWAIPDKCDTLAASGSNVPSRPLAYGQPKEGRVVCPVAASSKYRRGLPAAPHACVDRLGPDLIASYCGKPNLSGSLSCTPPAEHGGISYAPRVSDGGLPVSIDPFTLSMIWQPFSSGLTWATAPSRKNSSAESLALTRASMEFREITCTCR